MEVRVICLSFTPTSQSKFCPRSVVRDSDTEHGPGDQRQFMGGNKNPYSWSGACGWEEGTGERLRYPHSHPSRPRAPGCWWPGPNFRVPGWPCSPLQGKASLLDYEHSLSPSSQASAWCVLEPDWAYAQGFSEAPWMSL